VPGFTGNFQLEPITTSDWQFGTGNWSLGGYFKMVSRANFVADSPFFTATMSVNGAGSTDYLMAGPQSSGWAMKTYPAYSALGYTIALDTWFYILLTRNGDYIETWVNGTMLSQVSIASSNTYSITKITFDQLSSGGTTHMCAFTVSRAGRSPATGAPSAYLSSSTEQYVDITASKSGEPNVTLRFTVNPKEPVTMTEYSVSSTGPWHVTRTDADEWSRTTDAYGAWGTPVRIRVPAITSALVPSSWNLPSTTDGVVTSYTGCNTEMFVYKDGADDSANWSFSFASDSGSTTPTSGSTKTATVTAVGSSNDTPYITFTATRATYATQTAKFQMFKQKNGGVSGPGITSFTGVYSNAGWVGLKFDKDGYVNIKKSSGGSYSQLVTYYQPPSTDIGAGVYIKVVQEAGTGTITGTLDTYQAISTDRIWYMTETTPGNYRRVIRIYIATSAAGANAAQYSVPFEIDVP